MGKKLTRIDWSDIKTALQLVPSRARTEAWVKLNSLTETILSKKADIAKEYSPETLRFSIDCKLCSKTISVLDSYVAHANGDTLHYDCNMVYKETA